MSKLKWRLEVYDSTSKYFPHVADEMECFFTLGDIWNHLGFKLPKQRCGYSGIKGKTIYNVVKI